MHTLCFCFGNSKVINDCPFVYFADALLQLAFCCTHMFRDNAEVINKQLSTPVFRQLVMLVIFMLKRVTDSIHPKGTLSSWFWMSDLVDLMWTQNFLSKRKAFMKSGSLPFNPMLCRSFMIPYLQVVLYAFFRSKNTATDCCFWIFASLMEVSNLTTWSTADL